MSMKLNPKSTEPLYYQVKQLIVNGIANGDWGVGDLIPSETQLCNELGVSRSTVIKAIEELVYEGKLTRKQGIGTFVTLPRIEQTLSEFYSFSDALAAQGLKNEVSVLSLTSERSDREKSMLLQIAKGSYLTKLTRIRYVNNDPFLLETSYIPEEIAPNLVEHDFEKQSLYKTLAREYRVFVTKAREMFEPVLISEEESKYLLVEPGSPAILLERRAYSSSDLPVEICYTIIPGKKCRFYTEWR